MSTFALLHVCTCVLIISDALLKKLHADTHAMRLVINEFNINSNKRDGNTWEVGKKKK